jgi:hypothetical protein
MRKIAILFVLLIMTIVITQQADIFSNYYQESRKIAEAMTID